MERYKYNGFLFYEELRDIDPMIDTLTTVQKQLVLFEIKFNLKYFINQFLIRNDSKLYLFKTHIVAKENKRHDYTFKRK